MRGIDARSGHVDQDVRTRRIAEAAYFKAQQRGFGADRALDDWLEAERELAAMTTQDAGPNDRNADSDPSDPSADIPQPDQRSGAPVPAPLGKENSIRVDEAKESAEQLKGALDK
jgi:hypothetical protein